MSKFDDPVEAALEQLRKEREEDSGFLGPLNELRKTAFALTDGIHEVAKHPSGATIFSISEKIAQAWRNDQESLIEKNQTYVIGAIIEKLKTHDSRLDSQSGDMHRLTDAIDHTMSHVRAGTSRDKLDDLAAIAVSGALVYKHEPIEYTEEFMRITAALQRTDMMVLHEIARVEHEKTRGNFDSDQKLFILQQNWPTILDHLTKLAIEPSYVQSALVRLQSHGLIERVNTNVTSNRLGETPYRLLELGSHFLRYLTKHNLSNQSK